MSEAGGRAVGVVAVTHDSENVLPGLLESLEGGLADLDWSLVVVDSGSRDRGPELVREQCPRARVLELDSNRGFAAGVNRGLAELGRDADLLIVNPDVRLGPGSGARLQARLGVAVAGARPPAQVGIAAPRLVDADGALVPSLRFEPSVARALAEAVIGVQRSGRHGWGETILDPSAYERSTISDWISGAVLMISRECLAACGPWEERFFLYSEEVEYALRARRRGFAACLAEDARATHLGGGSLADPALWTLLVLNKLDLYRRRHGRAGALAFRLAALLREARLAACGNRPSRRAARALLAGREPSR